jgi:CheY-like chemotaxis protein
MKNLLIIEDEPTLRRRLRELLEMEGFKVLTAACGKEGIAIAEQESIHLVLCDVMMVGIDGYQVLERLRATPRTQRLPFVFLTAKQDPEALRRGFQLGANDFLTKPVRREELLRVLSDHLEPVLEESPSSLQGLPPWGSAPDQVGSVTALKLALEMLPNVEGSKRHQYLAIIKSELDRWSESVAPEQETEDTNVSRPTESQSLPSMRTASKRTKDVRLRIPEELLAEIDAAVERRRPVISRHQWILEALTEKAEQEQLFG